MELLGGARWLWRRSRRSLCVLVVFFSEPSRAIEVVVAAAGAGAPPPYESSGKKARMEIRVQDYSYSNGARERPVVEVVARDIKTSDLLTLSQTLGSKSDMHERVSRAEPPFTYSSWWQEPIVEDLSVGDLVLLMTLAVVALLGVRLAAFVLKITWRIVTYPFRVSSVAAAGTQAVRRKAKRRATRQASQVRACHSQLLRVVHQLRHELLDSTADDTQTAIASLALTRRTCRPEQVTLDEVMATLRAIQVKNPAILNSQPGSPQAEKALDRAVDADEDWRGLQRLYSSFLSLHSTISRQVARKKEGPLGRSRQRSFDARNDEVLRKLSELTKELPQGFTAEMFASLGNAMLDRPRSGDRRERTSDRPSAHPSSAAVEPLERVEQ